MRFFWQMTAIRIQNRNGDFAVNRTTNCPLPPFWSMSVVVRKHYRVIITICKHVVSNNALPSRCIFVRIDKPPDLGIIVSALAVIQSSLGIVDIAAISQRIDLAMGTGCFYCITIRSVLIIRRGLAAGIDQSDNISLEVIVHRSTVLQHGVRRTIGIIEEVKDGIAVGLTTE